MTAVVPPQAAHNHQPIPVISGPAGKTVLSPDGQPGSITFGAPTVSLGAAPITTACSPASGSLFPVGSTSVVCTATDALQRTASCNFNAKVTKASSASSAVSNLPLLRVDNFRYLGAFRLPAGPFGSEGGFSFGGTPMAYNPANNSLFVGGHPYDLMIAEVSIPTPVESADLSALPFATVLQNFADPTEGNAQKLSPEEQVNLGGLLVSGGKLYGTVYIYYDKNGNQRKSHYSRSLDLTTSSVSPFDSVWAPEVTGFVSGYLATVPGEWQADLGGSAITGNCCIPIVSRTSWGPAAIAWNPRDLETVSPVPGAALSYYTGDHATLGPWEGSNPIWGGTTQIAGAALVAGSRTAMFVGTNGTGRFCYGVGTDDPLLDGLLSDDGESDFCYDPTSGDKGTHAYPYNFQFWAYDMDDWAAVRAGAMEPWEVMPYAVWSFTLPTDGAIRIGGVGYDAQRQLLYVSQLSADADEHTYRPLIHVFHIQ